MRDYPGKGTFKLGFGLMRLPKLDGGGIDTEQVKKMVDIFIAGGGTYFDTAYVYDGGRSEIATKEVLVDRYPRDSYTLCTKLNAGIRDITEQEAKAQFMTSLERTGAGYFDYYLLHALQISNYRKYDEFGLWDYVRELKEKGLVKHYGFSFHATPKLLRQLLTEHPDVDFIQLQINYADWDSITIESRECYEIAREFGVPFTVMEPLKGGSLADPPLATVRELFREAAPEASFSSWGIRFAASLDGVITVLSGMSNLAQVEDNMSYMKNFVPLSDAEKEVVRKARLAIHDDRSIQCTACHYCVDGCPMTIHIPEIFSAMNQRILYGGGNGAFDYARVTSEHRGKASDCIECGACEDSCPQSLPIRELLKKCSAEFKK